MNKYKEKEIKKYVIADLSQPTNYLKSMKDGRYSFIDNVVIATKLYYPMFDGANAKGLSRKAIFQEVEHSLKRLQMDYIDLYIIHRWDYTTPI